MNMKNYEYFEVTADIGFKAYGNDINEAFENAGIAMFNIITDICQYVNWHFGRNKNPRHSAGFYISHKISALFLGGTGPTAPSTSGSGCR